MYPIHAFFLRSRELDVKVQSKLGGVKFSLEQNPAEKEGKRNKEKGGRNYLFPFPFFLCVSEV
jgi:hypothetical protein